MNDYCRLMVPCRWYVSLAVGLAVLAIGAAAIVAAYQVPARHEVNIGGYDAAYVRGFHDAQDSSYPSGHQPYLQGSDGRVRWSRARSFLVFPQAGLPASVTLRIRGWRPASPDYSPPVVHLFLNGQTFLRTIQTSEAWEEYHVAIAIDDGGLRKVSDVVIELRSETTLLPDEGREVGVLLDRARYTVSPGPRGFIVPYPSQVAGGALAVLLLWLVLAPCAQTCKKAAKGAKSVKDAERSHALRHLSPDPRPLTPVPRPPPSVPRPPPSVPCSLLSFVGIAALVGVAFLLLYRLPPPLSPYPLRWLLPALNAALLLLLAVRHLPAVIVRKPWLLDVAAVGGGVVWIAWVLLVAQDHLTLSVPGVEKDFRVFATRAPDLGRVFQADGFYQSGYPLLLWLVRPLTAGNAFLAARLIAVASGAVLLLACGWMARRLLASVEYPFAARSGMLLALLVLALSPLVVQYALYVGSDMPFAACVSLSLAMLVSQVARHDHDTDLLSKQRNRSGPPTCPPPTGGMNWEEGTGEVGKHHTSQAMVVLAGVAAGGAFLLRHPGIVLLPWGVLTSMLLHPWPTGPGGGGGRSPERRYAALNWLIARYPPLARGIMPLLFVAGFLLAAFSQLAINAIQTGQPLYSHQAKNIWLAVYGGIDWGRWGEVPDTIGLGEIVLHNPGRFVGNWLQNIRNFTGTGAEDTSEYGRAVQLRLLGWPANWLAVAGLLVWAGGVLRWRGGAAGRASLLLFLVLYVLAIAIAFILPRFFLPLAPIYAVAAASLILRAIRAIQWATRQAMPHTPPTAAIRRLIIVCAGLLLLLGQGPRIGAHYVLDHQPHDERAIIRLALDTMQPGERVLVWVEAGVPIASYSALAHRAVTPSDAPDREAALEWARHQPQIAYLLRDEAAALPPFSPGLLAVRVGGAGRYGLYRLERPGD